MYIYINFHCQKCCCAFYCDKTCLKNHKQRHDEECSGLQKYTPTIIYPLQVEIHCGGDLGENVEIYYQHEKRITLKHSGINFFNNLFKILLKNRWLKNNGYNIVDQSKRDCILLEYKSEEPKTEKKQTIPIGLADPLDQVSQTEEELFLKMPCIQELRVIFLNNGAILQDIIKETYDLYTHFAHIYYFPI